jgi:YHS domain-containing protein
MKKLLVSGIILTGVLISWGCEKAPAPPQETTQTAIAPDAFKIHAITDAEVRKPAKCPVTGDEFIVNKFTPALEYKGKTYLFCCADCLVEFKKNPDKYAGAPAPTPTADTPKPAETVKAPVLPHTITDAEVGQKAICPVMDSEVIITKDTLSAEYKGKVYYFCCAGCPDEFKANPDKFAK